MHPGPDQWGARDFPGREPEMGVSTFEASPHHKGWCTTGVALMSPSHIEPGSHAGSASDPPSTRRRRLSRRPSVGVAAFVVGATLLASMTLFSGTAVSSPKPGPDTF